MVGVKVLGLSPRAGTRPGCSAQSARTRAPTRVENVPGCTACRKLAGETSRCDMSVQAECQDVLQVVDAGARQVF